MAHALLGAAFTTATIDDNQTIFTQGIDTLDIQNHSNYDGKAISVGVSLGQSNGKASANMQGIGYGSDGDSQTSTTKAGVTGMAAQADVTTATKDSLNEVLVNSFDASTVNEELGAQVDITRAFDQERRKIKTELNKEEQDLRDAAKEQEALGNYIARDTLLEQANDIQQKALLFDGISSALYGPNANGATGYVAKAVSPQVAYKIGQYFKDNDAQNRENQNTELAGVNSPQHLLAHALLGAAVSAATGNDALTGGISASSGEVTATLLSKYIYQVDDSSELTAEQKDTISNITTLAGVAIGTSTGEVTDAVNAGETAKVAVEDNSLKKKDVEELLRRINVAKHKYTGAQLDAEMRRIRAEAAQRAAENWKEIKACEENPTAACLNKIKVEYSNVNFKELKDEYRLYPGTPEIIRGYELRNNDIVTCSTSSPTDCVYINGGIRVMNGAVYELIGAGPKAGQWSKVPVKKPQTTKTPNTCSFRGDMLIKTVSGYKTIDSIIIGDQVLSRNEQTGAVSFQTVLNQYNNAYKQTVYIDIVDMDGNKQTIVSNTIHPFFVKIDNNTPVPPSSEGHHYKGEIGNANWVDASNLKAGYKLLSENGQWQIVQNIKVTDKPLSAYNLTVNNDHTYFVTGSATTYGVWVHNDCNLGTFASSRQASNSVKRAIGLPISQQPIKQGRTRRGDQWYIYNVPTADGKSKNVVVIKSMGDPKAGHDYVHYEAGDLKIQDNAPAFNQYGAPKIDNTGKVKAIVGN